MKEVFRERLGRREIFVSGPKMASRLHPFCRSILEQNVFSRFLLYHHAESCIQRVSQTAKGVETPILIVGSFYF